jgi:hypothetical protein
MQRLCSAESSCCEESRERRGSSALLPRATSLLASAAYRPLWCRPEREKQAARATSEEALLSPSRACSTARCPRAGSRPAAAEAVACASACTEEEEEVEVDAEAEAEAEALLGCCLPETLPAEPAEPAGRGM